MCADDNLETDTVPLDDGIVVAGPNPDIGTVAERATGDYQPRVVGTGDAGEFGTAVRDVAVVVVAMDGSSSATKSIVQVAENTEGFVVAVFGAHGDEHVEPSVLEPIREAVDVTLLACRKQPTEASSSDLGDAIDTQLHRSQSRVAVRGAFDFVRMIRKPGHINLDLADAQTVLTEGSLAVLAGGTASLETDGSERAVRRAFEEIPPLINAERGSDALVSVVGGPEMSIDDAIAAARTVREEVGNIDQLIWGVATDDALASRVTVDVVIDDITYRPPLSAGDPCRRCGATLAAYTFGEQTTLACENCGFADLSMSLDQ